MKTIALRSAVSDAAQSLPARVFVSIYVISLIVLVAAGAPPTVVMLQVGLLVWELIYIAISILITPSPPPDEPSRGRSLGGQIVFLLIVLATTWFLPSIASSTGLDYRVTNPLLYVIIPLVVLIGVFAVNPRGLGLRRGYRSFWVGLVWISVNLLFVIAQLVTSSFSAAFVVNRLVGNILQNGFAEEILWRGIVQTRLAIWLTPAWGAVISALVFGFWHFNANQGMFESAAAALAFCVVSQARFGLFMSIIFMRTRSIIAPGIAHTFYNLNILNFL